MKKFCHLTTENGDRNMWKIVAILNVIVVVLVVELFDHSLTVVERLSIYTYLIIYMVFVLKEQNWKPSYLSLRERIPSLTLKDLVMRIKGSIRN